MNEDTFWSLIKAAWQRVGAAGDFRAMLAGRKLTWEETRALMPPLQDFLRELRLDLDRLPAEELLAFERIVERKLYDLDRAEVHQHTGGSDDGFLYARGFIVAAGRSYYDRVNVTPAAAVGDLDCEEMCFLASRLYREKFGKVTLSDISIATGSNQAGWAKQAEDTSASLEEAVRVAWTATLRFFEEKGTPLMRKMQPSEPEELRSAWSDCVEYLWNMFAKQYGEEDVPNRFHVPDDYATFMEIIGGGWEYPTGWALQDAAQVAEDTGYEFGWVVEFANETSGPNQVRDNGLWLTAGTWSDFAETLLICCDRAHPCYGRVFHCHKEHPWTGGIDSPNCRKVADSFLEYLQQPERWLEIKEAGCAPAQETTEKAISPVMRLIPKPDYAQEWYEYGEVEFEGLSAESAAHIREQRDRLLPIVQTLVQRAVGLFGKVDEDTFPYLGALTGDYYILSESYEPWSDRNWHYYVTFTIHCAGWRHGQLGNFLGLDVVFRIDEQLAGWEEHYLGHYVL